MDGIGAGLGYAVVLFIVGLIRELMGFGEIFNRRIIPESWYATALNPDGYENFALMVTPPAAFFILGMMIWVMQLTKLSRK
jgi:Na+-transporting NADH:ubiquinone oxidoreductase subunit D